MAPVAIDFEAEGLLDGVEGKARDARRELLEELEADGVSREELHKAVEEDRLAMLPVERIYEEEGRRYTAAEIAEESGLEVEFLQRQRQDLGLPAPDPSARELTRADLEAAQRLKLLRDTGIDDEGIREVSRIVGMAMAQVASATTRLVAEALLREGDTERDVARRFAGAAAALRPGMGPMLQYVLDLHQREQLRQDAVGRAELESGHLPGSTEVTVAFADLVGFTKLGEQLEITELGVLTGRLGELAREVTQPPVRLVKLIGDAAMLVSPESSPLLDATLALTEAAEQEGEGFPLIRAGVAHGQALPRAGDWYGRPVNLASRITSIAYPSSVLCAADVRDAVGDGYLWSRAGRRSVKGISGPVELVRVRRAGD